MLVPDTASLNSTAIATLGSKPRQETDVVLAVMGEYHRYVQSFIAAPRCRCDDTGTRAAGYGNIASPRGRANRCLAAYEIRVAVVGIEGHNGLPDPLQLHIRSAPQWSEHFPVWAAAMQLRDM